MKKNTSQFRHATDFMRLQINKSRFKGKYSVRFLKTKPADEDEISSLL